MATAPASEQAESLEIQKQRSILNSQRKDAEVALEWFNSPGYARIHERYQAILSLYEARLHDTGIGSEERDRAAWAVSVAKRFLGVREDFENQLKFSKAKLSELDSDSTSSVKPWERILSFIR